MRFPCGSRHGERRPWNPIVFVYRRIPVVVFAIVECGRRLGDITKMWSATVVFKSDGCCGRVFWLWNDSDLVKYRQARLTGPDIWNVTVPVIWSTDGGQRGKWTIISTWPIIPIDVHNK
jgi:hypothetical protein